MAKHHPGLALRAARWLRSYLVVALLAGAVAATAVAALAKTSPPNPEYPPLGYAVDQDSVQLQWSPGSTRGAVRVEVVADAPEFAAGRPRFYDRRVTGRTATLSGLEAGRTYYWRVGQGERAGRVASFTVRADALRY